MAVTWRNGSTPRALIGAARTRWDELLTGAAVSERFQDTVRLPIDNLQPLETEIWERPCWHPHVCDSVDIGFLERIVLDMHAIQHEPRLFTVPDLDGQLMAERLTLTETTTSVVGNVAGQDANYWLSRRQDLEEKLRLERDS